MVTFNIKFNLVLKITQKICSVSQKNDLHFIFKERDEWKKARQELLWVLTKVQLVYEKRKVS